MSEAADRALQLRQKFRLLRDVVGPDEAERSLIALLAGATSATDPMTVEARDLAAAVRQTVEKQDDGAWLWDPLYPGF